MHRGAKASSAKVKDGKNANAENGGRINVKRVNKCDVLEKQGCHHHWSEIQPEREFDDAAVCCEG